MRYLCLGLMVCASLLGQEKTGDAEKLSPREKARQLLDVAAETVTSARPEVQVAALMHLGASYHELDTKKSLKCLEDAFAAAADLPSAKHDDRRGQMQAEVVKLTADVSIDKAVEMLRQITASASEEADVRMRPTEKIVRLLIDKNQLDRAMEIVESVGSSGQYPFSAARLIFQKLPADDARRLQIFSSATTAFMGRPKGPFAEMLSSYWQEVPRSMVEAALQAVLNALLDSKDDSEMRREISTAKGAVSLNSRQDVELFNLIHVVRAIDPKRADELLETRPGLRAALERFPKGLESMRSGDHDNMSMSTYSGNAAGLKTAKAQADQAQRQLRALAESRAAEALAYLKEDPQKAVSLVPGIPVPAMQVTVLGTVARSVGEKDPTTARSVLAKCLQHMESVKEPGERLPAWDIVAEAAHRAKDDELAWKAIDHGVSDAAALYKIDADDEGPNLALREYWPSTQGYRRMVGRATTIFGVEAEPLLARITDPDLALLARIEMAQALLGHPTSSWNVSVNRPPKKK